MLHPIEPPAEARHLEAIVEIQRDLLVALTVRSLQAKQVDVAWVVQASQTLTRPVAERLANLKDKVAGSGRTLVENARVLAAEPPATRQAILDGFDRDRDLADTYDTATPAKPLQGLGAVSGAAALALRGLLTCFYDPQLYNGRSFLVSGFTRDTYLKAWRRKNPRVCPYCDTRPRGFQLDHYAPKSRYPSLSCHPDNLVPACGDCNTRWKRDRDVFTEGVSDPAADWLHPVYRSLGRSAGSGVRHRFSVEFVRGSHRRWDVHFTPTDGATQAQVDNYSDLVGLAEYWADEADDLVKEESERFARYCEYEEIDTPSSADLDAYLRRELAMIGLGQDSLGLLRKAYLQRAVGRSPDIYDEVKDLCLAS